MYMRMLFMNSLNFVFVLFWGSTAQGFESLDFRKMLQESRIMQFCLFVYLFVSLSWKCIDGLILKTAGIKFGKVNLPEIFTPWYMLKIVDN